MQIETGCRVAEIALLRTEDLHLDAPIPYVRIIQHLEHSRRLKTGKNAERSLPLVGVSLRPTAARAAANDDGWLFLRIGKGTQRAPSTAGSSALSEGRRGEPFIPPQHGNPARSGEG